MKPIIIRKPAYRTAAPLERRNNFIRTTKALAASLGRAVLVAKEKEKRS